MNKWELARRDLLKTLGVGVGCLPLLKASRSWAQAEVANRKFMVIHLTEGYRPNGWKPNPGPLTTLPDSMTPLEPHKDYLCVLPEMSNRAYGGGVRYGHESYGSIYWGGGVKGPKYKEPTGNTLDQVIADGLGKVDGGRTSVHFQVQLDRRPSQSQRGGNRCFWRDGNPLNPESNPATTYASLFAGVMTGGGGATAGPSPADMEAVKKTLGQKKSILDYVGKSLERFKTRVAKEDRVMIDGHLRSVRELEGQLSTMVGPPAAGGGACSPADPGAFTDDQILQDDQLYPKISDAYMNMMLAALSCGLTKVATLQVGDSTGNQINFGAFVPGIPVRGTGYKSAFRNWHDLGHNPVMGGTDHKRIVDKWWMAKLNEFMGMMKAIPDGPGGSLLDTSLLLWGNHMESGDSHHSQKVPWILAGKAGGKIKTGQAAPANNKDINDAMGDICRGMGVMPLGHWNGSIPGVVA